MLLLKYESFALLNRSRKIYRTFPAAAATRKTDYEPLLLSKTCLLKPEKGPCRSNILMYFFDPDKKDCNAFEWGGCQGNGNRFETREECMGSCMSGEGYKKGAPKYCQLTYDYGWCFGAEHRWYYDKFWKVCKKTIYSGCGGNRNNFYNKEQCDTVCRLGLPPMIKGTNRNKDGMIKVLIINPDWATTKPTRAVTTAAPVTEPPVPTKRTGRTDVGDCGQLTQAP